jgi:hypothetical protein
VLLDYLPIPPKDPSRFFSSVQVVTHFDHPWMVPEERNVPIYIAQSPTLDLKEAWRQRTWRK